MPELFLDVVQLFAGRDHQARVGVAQVMEADVAQSRRTQQRAPHTLAEVVGVHRPRGRVGKDPGGGRVSRLLMGGLGVCIQGHDVAEPLLATQIKRRAKLTGKIDAPGLLVLGRRDLASHERALHHEEATVRVNIPVLQRDRLPEPQARARQEQEERVVRSKGVARFGSAPDDVVLRGREQGADSACSTPRLPTPVSDRHDRCEGRR